MNRPSAISFTDRNNSHHQAIGKIGENLAVDHLLKMGFKILHRNFHTRYAELDIIAEKDDKIFFVEVKTRLSMSHGHPYEAINYHKIKALKRAISYFLLKNPKRDCKLSLDLIGVTLNNDRSLQEIKYYKNIIS